MKTKLYLGALLAVALLMAPGVLEAAGKPPGELTLKLDPDSEAEHQIEVVSIGKKRIAALISATAAIEPDPRKVARVTPRIRARVVRLIADPGQRVKPGEPLAILSSVELGRAKTEFLKARSLSEIARQHLAREESLFKRKVASKKDVLQARANYDTALAQYQAARETLIVLIPSVEVARISWSAGGHRLSDFTLSSPIAGTLVKRDLILGQIVNGDAEVITVMNLDHVWVLANVFEHDLAGLAIGARARVQVDAYPDQTFGGVVSYLSDTVDSKTRTVQARIDVPNPGHLLKPGMFARVEIDSTRGVREVLAAPASAIYEISGNKAVFVQTEPHVFSVRQVVVGAAGHHDIEVVAGLQEGERVVTKGGLVLKSLLVNAAD